MALRFNPPPGWPAPPEGFVPGPGWRPDPGWPPPPPGWQLWVPADPEQAPVAGQGQLTPGYVGYGPPEAPVGSPRTSAGWGPPEPPRPGTSGMAVAAFVLGLLGIVGVSAILGIIFGIVALNDIRRAPQGGKGLAIAGIVLGSAWLALTVILIVIIVISIASGSGSTP